MGECAEAQWQWEMRKGRKHKPNKKVGRNPIEAYCQICGKGIRPVAGRIKESMAAHMKAKHKIKT